MKRYQGGLRFPPVVENSSFEGGVGGGRWGRTMGWRRNHGDGAESHLLRLTRPRGGARPLPEAKRLSKQTDEPLFAVTTQYAR